MSSSAPQTAAHRLQGPQEDYDSKWRTTKSHTPQQMVSVYRELFFAGFPRPTQTATKGIVAFPPQLVKEFFLRFGVISHFYYDETRGIGAVTFDAGEDAERCYITTHLSVMGGGGRGNSAEDSNTPTTDDNNDLATIFGPQSALLYLEFAQFLPFVNPLMLNGNLVPLSINRHLLRTFPVAERNQSFNSANFVVYETKLGPIEKHRESIRLPGAQGAVQNLFVLEGLVSTLLPAGTADQRSSSVTVIDLWAQYVEAFVVSKTQPSKSRISNPDFAFAAKASPYQDVIRHCKALAQGSASERYELQRFADDDVMHSTMAYVCFKLRFGHDPSLMSLLRAVESRVLRNSTARGLAVQEKPESSKTSRDPDPDDDDPNIAPANIKSPSQRKKLADAVSSATESAEASERLLKLSVVDCARNVLQNAAYFYGKKSQGDAATLRAKGASYVSDDDEMRFRCVLDLFEGYASSGSAASLVTVCCPFEEFAGEHGLIATMPTLQKMLWGTLKFPLLFLLLLAVGLYSLIHFS